MRKVVMLSAAAILGIASIAVSQAEGTADTPVTTSEVVETQAVAEAAPAETDAAPAAPDAVPAATEEAAPAAEAVAVQAAPADEEPIPTDTPQVQKLIALYPNLIARIQPVARICFEGETCDVTARSSGASADGGPRDGVTVYGAVCQTCHTGGLLGSPVLGDAGAWGPRIAQGKDTLYTHAINGFNAMPAKGGADIPDEEVQNAVDYMISQAS